MARPRKVQELPQSAQVEVSPVIDPQPPQDNEHVAPGAELFADQAPDFDPAQELPQSADESVVAESLAAYIARIEEQAQPLAVCRVTHPDAIDGAIHEGKYAGIRLVKGADIEALIADGSTL